MIERYYPRQRRDDLQRRERGLGAGAIQQTESEWSQLIAMLERGGAPPVLGLSGLAVS
jgi:hypothetical protein